MSNGIREYGEELPVEIVTRDEDSGDVWVINALNECGYNGTAVDLMDVLKYVKKKLPELWNHVDNESGKG